MEEPKSKKCDECKEMIYGLTEKDLNYKMLVHKLKHRDKEDKDDRK